VKPHSWERCPDPESEDGAPRARSPRARTRGPGVPTFWVRCTGCGATVVTDGTHFPGACHEGWRMPEDCEVTVVEQIMEE